MLDVASGQYRPITGHAKYEGYPAFSPDGNYIAYQYPRDGQIKNGSEIYVTRGVQGEGSDISREINRNIVRALWLPDSKSMLFGADDATTVGLWVQPLNGQATRLKIGDICPSWAFWVDVSVGPHDEIAFTGSEPHRPTELYYLPKPTAEPIRLTTFNAWSESLEFGKTETIEWNSRDGYREDGVLTYPPNFSSNQRYPLVLWIHGGPPAASHDTFSPMTSLIAAQGWVVFEPNYRGSDNLGNKYQAAISDDAGEGPGRDVMAGLAEVKKRGFVDPSNIAVTGWSYGGFMTVWLLGHYGGWKAAIAGAAMTDWVEHYDLSDFNVRIADGFAAGPPGSPYVGNRMKAYVEQSPITYADKIKTPTLI
ncbi:MAG: prolyl oligopeptidase family serine peptidase, partial [Acidobacteriota bacterium]|nr:prolyl oligopeptidase family serine peptidase [Acidobacteriota bacterium]